MENNSILLIANYKPDRQFSMLRYVELIENGLIHSGAKVKVWYPPEFFAKLIPRNISLYKWFAYLDKYFLGGVSLLLSQLGYARVHICDHSNAVYEFVIWGRRATVTCHDVIAIEAALGLVAGWETGLTGRLLQRSILAGLRRCDAVFCVSQFTKAHLLALNGINTGRVTVVYNPIDPRLTDARPEAATASWGEVANRLAGDYVMHIGSDLPRKNRLGVLRIFCELIRKPGFTHCNLLMIGPDLNFDQQALIKESGLSDRVVVVRLPKEADLAAAYRGARCLIFPSYLEGFGWPIAEAQALGCPVFTTAAEPMIEVGGAGAIYIDPDDARQTAQTIALAELCEMRATGLKSIERFDINKLINAVLKG